LDECAIVGNIDVGLLVARQEVSSCINHGAYVLPNESTTWCIAGSAGRRSFVLTRQASPMTRRCYRPGQRKRRGR
jgi:hypothetical protein